MKLALTYPCVMGICNITPDSFYDGGKHSTTTKALHHIETMVTQGADIIDIGAYSSRPGAIDISIDEEFSRLQPIIVEVRKHFPDILISIDTFRSEIVTRVYHTIGNILVNDISGGLLDTAMLPTCGTLNVPYICMHMQGTPRTMQDRPTYDDVVKDVLAYLRERELVTSVYVERQLPVRLDTGQTVMAVAYLVDRAHPQYAGALAETEAAETVSGAVGQSGANEDYVISTVAHLRALRIRDAWLENVADRLAAPSTSD